MFDISPTLHNSVSRLWLCPPGNHPVVDLYGSFELKLADFLFKGFFHKNAAPYLTMGPKKGRRVRKIEVPIDSISEFELGHIWADIQ